MTSGHGSGPVAPNDSALVEALGARGVRRRYRAGVVFVQEGDRGDTLFVIVSGRVKAFVENDRGRELTLGVYGPSECVGEMVLDGGPRSASMMTMEPTELSVIDRATLTAFIAEHPEFAMVLLARAIRRARLATETARGLALMDTYGRLKQLLRARATARDDGTSIVAERLTHQQIADAIGASREMVSRLLKDLTAGGYIRLEARRMVIARTLPSQW